ncbi:hypothetical protein HanIR_Chr07g0321771 [Helianthus annuus]|nr:hypothetical protein HanIR_Chr07g0321771 [Helianthus annuus]
MGEIINYLIFYHYPFSFFLLTLNFFSNEAFPFTKIPLINLIHSKLHFNGPQDFLEKKKKKKKKKRLCKLTLP